MTALQKYTDLRSWLRHAGRGSLHAGTNALLAGAGTNSLEGMAPEVLRGIGFDWRQMIAVFAAAVFWEVIRRINAVTADAVSDAGGAAKHG